MVLQYCSDLHLEFRENKQFLNQHPLQPKAEILILAGDIVPFSEMVKRKDFFNYISDNFKITYWLPGNHEYCYSDAAERSGSFGEKIRDNIFLVNNISIQQGDIRLIFSTL
jgi:predicted phosphohydrolase